MNSVTIVVMEIAICIALGLFGVCLGSFAAATVWRLRARQLAYDKAHKEPYDKKEYTRLKKLLGKSVSKDRSQCLHCGYELKWYDLLPVVSWLSLAGKCRNCKHPIGWFELISELAVGTFFVGSYLLWPGGVETIFDGALLGTWLIAGVVMAILFAYDYKWYLLPDTAVLVLTILGIASTIFSIVQADTPLQGILSAAGSVAILGGLYAFLYFFSKGAWVGFGDVKLGLALGLLLADWRLAFVALFLANLIGCLIVVPMLISKKLTRTSRVPFGPMLIAGAVLAWFLGPAIIEWYLPFVTIIV